MTTINLQQFCASSYDPREHLQKPWAHQGYTYAVNGDIMIRVPCPEQDDARVEHAAGMSLPGMFDAAGKASYIALPEFEPPKPCETCCRKGRYLQMKCSDCDGKGSFYHGDYEYDCQRCDGDGMVRADEGDVGAELHDCPVCDGIGFFHGKWGKVGDAAFDAVYLRMLSALPGLRVCTNGEKAMHFVFDGGEGLLMPRRAD